MLQDADAIILVYDHGRRETLTHLRRWLELVKETWAGVNKPVVLAGNKVGQPGRQGHTITAIERHLLLPAPVFSCDRPFPL